jgi:hypothetical protein
MSVRTSRLCSLYRAWYSDVLRLLVYNRKFSGLVTADEHRALYGRTMLSKRLLDAIARQR